MEIELEHEVDGVLVDVRIEVTEWPERATAWTPAFGAEYRVVDVALSEDPQYDASDRLITWLAADLRGRLEDCEALRERVHDEIG